MTEKITWWLMVGMLCSVTTALAWDLWCVYRGMPTVTEVAQEHVWSRWIAGIATGSIVLLHFVAPCLRDVGPK